MSKGKIVIIVAPSGTGKSTLITELKKEFSQLKESVSYTTRPMREGEVDGEHYNFISVEDFQSKKAAGDFLEWAEVHTNFYGTSKSFVEEKLTQGNDLLFDLDVQGVDSFKDYFKDEAQAIFIAPPSIEELEKRLRGRGTDTDGVIETRLANSKKEILRKDDYDFLVYNDDFDKAYGELSSIVKNILEGN